MKQLQLIDLYLFLNKNDVTNSSSNRKNGVDRGVRKHAQKVQEEEEENERMNIVISVLLLYYYCIIISF